VLGNSHERVNNVPRVIT